jgi:hypothetical protein
MNAISNNHHQLEGGTVALLVIEIEVGWGKNVDARVVLLTPVQ